MILEFAGGVDDSVDPADVPELEDLYPEATMFDVLPAYAFFIPRCRRYKFVRCKGQYPRAGCSSTHYIARC